MSAMILPPSNGKGSSGVAGDFVPVLESESDPAMASFEDVLLGGGRAEKQTGAAPPQREDGVLPNVVALLQVKGAPAAEPETSLAGITEDAPAELVTNSTPGDDQEPASENGSARPVVEGREGLGALSALPVSQGDEPRLQMQDGTGTAQRPPASESAGRLASPPRIEASPPFESLREVGALPVQDAVSRASNGIARLGGASPAVPQVGIEAEVAAQSAETAQRLTLQKLSAGTVVTNGDAEGLLAEEDAQPGEQKPPGSLTRDARAVPQTGTSSKGLPQVVDTSLVASMEAESEVSPDARSIETPKSEALAHLPAKAHLKVPFGASLQPVAVPSAGQPPIVATPDIGRPVLISENASNSPEDDARGEQQRNMPELREPARAIRPQLEVTPAGQTFSVKDAPFGAEIDRHSQVPVILRAVSAEVERMTPARSMHVELDVPVREGEVVRVRLNLRGGELRSTFRTDSVELRDALERAWPEFAQRTGERGIHLREASFESAPSRQDPSFTQGGNQNRRELRGEQAGEPTAMIPGTKRVGAAAPQEAVPASRPSRPGGLSLYA